jgi:hypothetical protein
VQPVQKHANQDNAGADAPDDQRLSGHMKSFPFLIVFIVLASLCFTPGTIPGFRNPVTILFPF